MNQKKPSIFSTRMLEHVVFSSLLEFGPVILFLFAFRRFSIYESTMLLMAATIVTTVLTYHLQKRIPYLALYVAFITTIFGYMTLHFHEARFIQMRDTLYDATCAATLIIGVLLKVPFLKLAFDKVIPMTDRAWNKLTKLWIFYFTIVALSNEVARNFFSLHEWFFFKGCMIVVTSICGLVFLYISYEQKMDEDRG